ncbi:hypothetical protein ACHAQH_003414 [Verticillium albo-atrum]
MAGEKVKNTLLSEPAVRAASSRATVKVVLDTEDYQSVLRFATALQEEFQDLHILMGNAGIGTLGKEIAVSGHEKNNQVYYFSNVLLTLALLPTLEATAVRREVGANEGHMDRHPTA